MAPQTDIPLVSDILSTLGTLLLCVQLVPQVWYNWRHKKTDGVPSAMMLLWATSVVPFGAYNIVQDFAVPLQIQPHMDSFFAIVVWAQIQVYSNGWRPMKAAAVAATQIAVFAGIEVLLVFTLRGPYKNGVDWPVLLVGILAATLLAASLLPPYFEVYKRHGRVVGFNFIFIFMDWLGALLSVLAIATQKSFDPLGVVLYIVIVVLEGGLFVTQGIWLFRTRALRQRAKDLGVDLDTLPEAYKYRQNQDDGEKKLGESIRNVLKRIVKNTFASSRFQAPPTEIKTTSTDSSSVDLNNIEV